MRRLKEAYRTVKPVPWILAACLLTSAGLNASTRTDSFLTTKRKLWPFAVIEYDTLTGQLLRRDRLGPLITDTFSQEPQISTLRPLWISFRWKERKYFHLLYPLFSYERDPSKLHWDLLNLIKFDHQRYKDGHFERQFSFFPFYFSKQSSGPDQSYKGLFPLYGDIRDFFSYNRVSWVLFPFYSKWERQDEITWATPWPFMKIRSGGGSRGLQLWPLLGRMQHPGHYDHRFFLWPFIYRHIDHQRREQPTKKLGILPFYASESGEGVESRTWLWPFFGYTRKEAPRYEEKRFLWPLWIKVRGEGETLDHWLPFFSRKQLGRDTFKRWWVWPFLKKERYLEKGLEVHKSQFLYFLYWSMEQRAPTFSAQKTHLWPFISFWDNGRGRRQFQFLSPLELFFPQDDVIRELYSSLFGLYRFEQKAPGHYDHNFLFKSITYEKKEEDYRFTIGPLLTVEPGSFEFLQGLLGRDSNDKTFQLFWMTF